MGVVQAEIQNQLNSIKTRSVLEKLFKLLLSYSKRNGSQVKEFADDLQELNDFYATMKDEFKLARIYWVNVSNEINALDELEMCKTRMQFAPDKEHVTNENANAQVKLDYMIPRNRLNHYFRIYEAKLEDCKHDLIRKLGQLLFLKNSFKVNLRY
jgi:hypothetical protein